MADSVNLSDFDYELPPSLIATRPAQRRDACRLLVMDRRTGGLEHSRFDRIESELRPGDCLVLNDSRVIPARLEGRRAGGGRVELLLLSRRGEGFWESMIKPARRIRVGERLALRPNETAEDPGGRKDRHADAEAWVLVRAVGPDGTRLVSLESSLPEGEVLDRFGRMPLPPYILAARRSRGVGEDDAEREDRERYQTVFAREPGSVAAPTAGLHFTREMLDRLQNRGVEIQRVTLHVGAGTFAPVKAERIEDHVMHAEHYEIGEGAAHAIEAARLDPGRRVVAVGTTVTRTLEACVLTHGRVVPARESTRLMIVPGFRFQAVDALLTNFHLPKSTLLMLVAAFAGREATLNAYREAIRHNYRFYSYGDAMFIR